MRIAVAQYNPLVGDVEGQVGRILETVDEVAGTGAELVVFPELYLVGYPPKDLLERRWFVAAVEEGLRRVVEHSARHPDLGILVGAPLPNGGASGKALMNAAVLAYRGRIEATVYKSLLPTYDVFDESRYFGPAEAVRPVPFRGEMLGISICEDAWNDADLWPGRRPY
ncbi:MAG: NAD+ synthase, partial [Chloroflexi bacterium]|nr:NAD+ synthase [Chloroflexota bacterium]